MPQAKASRLRGKSGRFVYYASSFPLYSDDSKANKDITNGAYEVCESWLQLPVFRCRPQT